MKHYDHSINLQYWHWGPLNCWGQLQVLKPIQEPPCWQAGVQIAETKIHLYILNLSN